MVDWDRVRELRDEIGEESYAEVVELFFEEVDAAIRRLERPGNLSEREADLHFLKGSALNLGFIELGRLCETGERDAAAGTLQESALRDVMEAYEVARATFAGGSDAG